MYVCKSSACIRNTRVIKSQVNDKVRKGMIGMIFEGVTEQREREMEGETYCRESEKQMQVGKNHFSTILYLVTYIHFYLYNCAY